MRLNLPVMLSVSLALHGGVMGGFALNRLHSTTAPTPNVAVDQPPTMILLTSEETPTFRQPAAAPVKTVAAQPVAESAPVAPPAPPKVVVKTVATAAPTPPPSLALEMNPNAHIRALPPEAVLSPSPAPRLNAHDGIVFILDVSGSMYEKIAGATRLAIAREVLSARIRALKDGTPFAITVYALTARNSGPLVAASNATRDAAVRFIKEDIDCGGGTDLPAGLTCAMQLGEGNLVLISDGDLNTNLTDLTTKAKAILMPDKQGPMLTVIGISPRHNTSDGALLKSVASLTGGTFVTVESGDQAQLVTSAKGD